MRTILKITFFVLLALGVAGECGAQDTLAFKPGTSLAAGSYVRDLYGTVWKVNIPISVAVTPPSTALKTSSGKAYYTYVSAGVPIQADIVSEVYAINVQEIGISPTSTPERNSQVFDSLLNSIPEGGVRSIYAPAGDYKFARQITIYRRPIHLFGDNGTIWGSSTKFYFPYNSTGIRIDRGGVALQETVIEKICLIGSGGDGSTGNGIHANSRVKLRDVTTARFSQNGVLIHANLDEGGDASGSSVEYCHSLENGHDGFFAGRVDANAILFIGNDARDNGRYGFNDDSFLGNNYISCMTHYNRQGDFFVRDRGNARSAFIACYAESGGKPSQFGPHSTIVGGFLASGYTQ